MKSSITWEPKNSYSIIKRSLRFYLPSTTSKGVKYFCTIKLRFRSHFLLRQIRNFLKHSRSNLLTNIDLFPVGVSSLVVVMRVVFDSRVLDVKLAPLFFLIGLAERGLLGVEVLLIFWYSWQIYVKIRSTSVVVTLLALTSCSEVWSSPASFTIFWSIADFK